MALTDNLDLLLKLDDNAASTTVVATVGSNCTLEGGDNTSVKHASGPNAAIPSAFLLNGTDDDIAISGGSFASGAAFSARALVKFGGTSGPILGTAAGAFNLHKNSDTTFRVFSTAFTVGSIGTSAFRDCVITRGTDNAVRVYLDGTASSSNPVTLSSTWAPTKVGNIGASFLSGTICYASIWSRELSAAEVTALYNGGNWLAYPFTATVLPLILNQFRQRRA